MPFERLTSSLQGSKSIEKNSKLSSGLKIESAVYITFSYKIAVTNKLLANKINRTHWKGQDLLEATHHYEVVVLQFLMIESPLKKLKRDLF